ncbi:MULTISPECIES: hypothetical protein [Mesorhizobium]|uniref:hypothetical protein n=1 Tax=Mesorhizobium TaxID=68287 RepID=UPI00301C471D
MPALTTPSARYRQKGFGDLPASSLSWSHLKILIGLAGLNERTRLSHLASGLVCVAGTPCPSVSKGGLT